MSITTKKFIAIWGDFEPGMNAYGNSFEVVQITKFTNLQGYEDEDIQSIQNLEMDQLWHCPLGNHYVIRIN